MLASARRVVAVRVGARVDWVTSHSVSRVAGERGRFVRTYGGAFDVAGTAFPDPMKLYSQVYT